MKEERTIVSESRIEALLKSRACAAEDGGMIPNIADEPSTIKVYEEYSDRIFLDVCFPPPTSPGEGTAGCCNSFVFDLGCMQVVYEICNCISDAHRSFPP